MNTIKLYKKVILSKRKNRIHLDYGYLKLLSSQTYSVAKLKLAIGNVQLNLDIFDWRWIISVSKEVKINKSM
jgi:hypothetical protein